MTDLETTLRNSVRLDELRRKLKAREGIAAYRDNIPALKAEIARLEALEPNDE